MGMFWERRGSLSATTITQVSAELKEGVDKRLVMGKKRGGLNRLREKLWLVGTLLGWFCPSPSTTAKVGRRLPLCHPDRSVPGFPATRHSPANTCAAFSKESRMKFAKATKFDRKSGVAQKRDLQFHFRAQRICPGRIASGFRFSINANCRSLRCATLRSG